MTLKNFLKDISTPYQEDMKIQNQLLIKYLQEKYFSKFKNLKYEIAINGWKDVLPGYELERLNAEYFPHVINICVKGENDNSILKINACMNINNAIFKLCKTVYKPEVHFVWTSSIIDGKEYKIEKPYKHNEYINFEQLLSDKSILHLYKLLVMNNPRLVSNKDAKKALFKITENLNI